MQSLRWILWKNLIATGNFSTTNLKMPKFSANISFMFTEKPFEERYKLAKECGFKAVESGFPFQIEKERILEAKTSANIKQVLINTFTGAFILKFSFLFSNL